MERRGNYFMPNNGQIGFSPLHMLGLSAIYPKSMQQGFVDVSVNTHTVDNNFSLFKSKNQETEIGNMKNDLLNTLGSGLPVGNSFSKFIGGFIGSKCLIGSSTGRENNFWGRVLQQYNNIIGSNNHLYISVSAVNSKENTAEYIKAGVVDAALLLSQNFDLFSSNNLISQEQAMGVTKKVSQGSPASSVEMNVQKGVTTEPKQSYAEVTKSRVANKTPCSAPLDRSGTCSKRLRSVRKYPTKLGQKEHSISTPLNNNWRYRSHCDDSAKHMDNTNYNRERGRKHCSVSRDNKQKSVALPNTVKGSGTPCTSEDQKMNHSRTKHVQHSASRPNRKLPGKKKLNSNLLSDIKEDCLEVDDYLMACEKTGSFNNKFGHCPTKKWTPPADQGSSSNYCANWRCRPYNLCDPCKAKDSPGNDVTDCYGSHTKQKTVTFETKQKENDKQNDNPETPVNPLTLEDCDNSSAKPISCSDSSLTECESLVSSICPILRTRISSECSVDSEDSFVIVFEASGEDSYEENFSETDSECSDSESDDDDTSSINSQCVTHKDRSDHHEEYDFAFSSDEEEIDFDDDDDSETEEEVSYITETELKEANERWESAYEDAQSAVKEPGKVHFAESPELTTVHKMIAWDFAYRMARLGPWEALARDRTRFHKRVEHMNRILSPLLQDQHRRKMWQKFQKDMLNVP